MSAIPGHVRDVLEKLNSAGFEAYPVGGCVRDSLLGKTPHDWDVCTAAYPDEMKEVFSDMRCIETGLKHGTLTVLSGGEPIEVTTFRSDGDYTDHRRPDSVRFVRLLREDLSRRDFTVNALCFDTDGGVIDMFDGQGDLGRRLIRCVGDAGKRFEEDALRILRALRFSSVLDFDIEHDTAKALREKAGLLKYVSAERIFCELKKLLTGSRAGRLLIEYREVFAVIIPELAECFDVIQNNPHHMYDVYTHICKSIDNIEPDETLRLTMLLHDIAKPRCKTTDENGIDHFKKHPFEGAKMADEILSRLRADNETRELICNYITEHDNRLAENERSVGRFISKHGYEFFDNYLKIRRADTLAQSMYYREEKLKDLDILLEIRAALEEKSACLTLKDLDLNGHDLIAAGYSGKEIGTALEMALDGVIAGNVQNDKKELIEYVSKQSHC
ncbi:CCA tRNA nucleotidyltransferase [Ruminococcus sp. NK3A76]|uniref:CCA tRNA nucleotidyltransferase n=1 Tax=Ruminococcus sp. NK3A76 TaxID=877411 RepID=UPI00048F2623|nr:CCA tRNA nucleotidyltransferase [Ruminococcus sp. NK3A76]